jgi:hypothetical protein
MIGKGKAIAHTGNALNYAMNKDKSEELARNFLGGDTPQEITKEFEMCQEYNSRCINNTLRFEISPSPKDDLTKEDFRGIAEDFANKMGLQDRQYIAVLHRDKEHTHIHLTANRIDFKGKAFDDKYISNKATVVAREIAQERGLTQARDIEKTRGLTLEKTLGKDIEKAHEKVMDYMPKDFVQYQKGMQHLGFEIEQVKSKRTGRVSGLRMGRVGGEKIKASAITRKIGNNTLAKSIGKNVGKSLTKSLTRATPLGFAMGIIQKTISVTQGFSIDRGDDGFSR